MIFVPKDFQQLMIAHLGAHERSNLWASPGTGKTVSSLTALDALSFVDDVYPTLAIGPMRVANSVWGGEVEKWAHLKGLRVVKILGTEAERLAAMKKPADIYTIHYGLLDWLARTLGSKWFFKTVICDESTRVKNVRCSYRKHPKTEKVSFYHGGAVNASALMRYAYRTPRWINLTGTPAPNGLKDLWGQQWPIDFGASLGSTYDAFSRRWFYQKRGTDKEQAVFIPMLHAEGEIITRVKPYTLSINAYDYFDCDKPREVIVDVELTEPLKKQYRKLHRESVLKLSEEKVITAVNAGALTNKCLQFASGNVYDTDRNVHHIHDLKLDVLESLIENLNGAPLIVAYHYIPDKEAILKRFKFAEVLPSGKEQKAVEDRWNKGEIPLLVVHPQCLHADTEVLTESRGWVRIVEVSKDERVFDGVEFVSHKGCYYSGHRKVIRVLGLLATPDHKFLLDGQWMEACDVDDCEDALEKASYEYTGNDAYLGQMCTLRQGDEDAVAERAKTQSPKKKALRPVLQANSPRNVTLSPLPYMVEYAQALQRFFCIGFQTLRRAWHHCLQAVGSQFSRVLEGHVNRLQQRHDAGAQECGWSLQQAQLQMGIEPRTTKQQAHNAAVKVSRGADALGRALQDRTVQSIRTNDSPKSRHVSGRSSSGLCSVDLRHGENSNRQTQKADVFDLVDCGPRHRFLVRNEAGQMFVSHNSAGHGLNLQHGGCDICIYTPDWNLEYYEQVIERIGPVRQMQSGFKRIVSVYNLVTRGTWDKVVCDRRLDKSTVQQAVMQAMRAE